jgi:hypothetical protein
VVEVFPVGWFAILEGKLVSPGCTVWGRGGGIGGQEGQKNIDLNDTDNRLMAKNFD